MLSLLHVLGYFYLLNVHVMCATRVVVVELETNNGPLNATRLSCMAYTA